jgi:hypothetical protein
MSFPTNPSNGDAYLTNTKTFYKYDSIDDKWYKPKKAIIPWTPELIETFAWYDASDTGTIYTSTGTKVNRMDDKSSKGNNLLQTNGSWQPNTEVYDINGLNTIYFEGLEDLRNLSVTNIELTGGFTAVAVAKYIADDTLSEIYTMRSVDGSDEIIMRRDSANDTITVNFTGDGGGTNFPRINLGNHTEYSNGVPWIATHFYDNNQHYLWGNGGTHKTSKDMPDNVTLTFNEIYLGHRQNGIDNAIGEVVFVEDYSIETRQKIEGYLSWKWGLVSNLPVDHPYKDAEPTA